MDANSSTVIKQKRLRVNPVKKWSVAEEKSLIEFLLENRELEKPTAQIFYRRFSKEMRVAADWKQVRSKVRNLKMNFYKAKQWEESVGQGNVDDSTIKSTLLKMCAYFDELEYIFLNHTQEFIAIEDSLDSGSENFQNSTEIFMDETTTASDTSKQDSMPVTASSSRKGIYSRTAESDIMPWQSDPIEIKKKKLDFDNEMKSKEVSVLERTMILKEKELLVKEKEIENLKEIKLKELELLVKEKEIENMKEIKLKELEIQKDLKMAELEMQERLAMEELNMKYKNLN